MHNTHSNNQENKSLTIYDASTFRNTKLLNKRKLISFCLCFIFISLLSSSINAQYILNNADIEINSNGFISSCNVTDFSTPQYQNGDIEIPENINGQTIIGIVGVSETDMALVPGIFGLKKIKKIHFPNTLKNIGNSAFYDNDITDIVFSNNTQLDSIGGWAFYGNELTSLSIPNGVKYIGEGAFSSNSIQTLNIPNSVSTIINYAFNYNLITEINGTQSNGIIYKRNADGTKDLSTIVSFGGTATNINFIPNSVITIDTWAFSTLNMTQVLIPNSVKTIGANAFNSGNLSLVSFESNSNLIFLDEDAFGRSSLATVNLPQSDYNGFIGWVDDNGNNYNAGDQITNFGVSYTAKVKYTLKDIDIKVDDGFIIECNQFYGTILSIPDSLLGEEIVGVEAGVFNKNNILSISLSTPQYPDFTSWVNGNGTSFSVVENNEDLELAFIAKPYTLKNRHSNISNGNLMGCNNYILTAVKELIIPEKINGQTIIKINYPCFRGIPLTKVSLPATLSEIGSEAFKECQLSEITIPANVTDIGDYAFSGSSDPSKPTYLKTITFEQNSMLKNIGLWAFAYNRLITHIDLPKHIEFIKDGAFEKDNISGNIVIPNSTKHIGKQSFADNALTQVTFVGKCKFDIIGQSAFDGNPSLKGITLPDSERNPFYGWLGDTHPTLFQSGDFTSDLTAFYQAQYPYDLNDADVTVQDGYIKTCSYPNSVSRYATIPDSLQGQEIVGISDIFIGAFYYRNLRSITLPNKLEYIGEHAFQNNNLDHVDLPSSIVHIGDVAFYANNNLTNMELPNHSNTPGFIGWRDGNNKLLEKTNNKYIVTDFEPSYTAAYEVLFKDYNSITKDTVNHFMDATPPSIGIRSGYTFVRWDVDYKSIKKGITVTAQYSNNGSNNYTVIFNNWDNTPLSTQIVTEGKSATLPTSPVRKNYSFLGWFKADGTEFTNLNNIVLDITVTAKFAPLSTIINPNNYENAKIYPNPAKDWIIIDNSNINTNKSITIVDSSGKVVYTNHHPQTKERINLKNFKKGLYLVKTDNCTSKIIVL